MNYIIYRRDDREVKEIAMVVDGAVSGPEKDRITTFLSDNGYSPSDDMMRIFHGSRVWAAEMKRDAITILHQHGGAGSGNFGHKGRPGKVGGSSPTGAGRPDKGLLRKIISQEIDRNRPLVEKIAKDLGIPMSKVHIADGMGELRGFGQTLATYDPQADEITVFQNALVNTNYKKLSGIMAHEWTHRQIHQIPGRDYYPLFDKVAEKHNMGTDIFRIKDGVSPYSKYVWNNREYDIYQAWDETLCEVARMKSLGDYDKVDIVWRDMYEAVQRQAQLSAYDRMNTHSKTEEKVIYLDADFNPVEKTKAAMAKVIPPKAPPYFVELEPEPAPSGIAHMISILRTHGGAGSGHFGHKGRPGKRGGSAPSGGPASQRYYAEGDTMSKYRHKDGTWDPERQKLHDQIIESFFKGKTPVDNPITYIMGGGPAAGKSSLLRKGIVTVPENHVLAAGDEIKAMLPEYDGGKNAHLVHEESSYLSKLIAARAAQGGYNVVLDGTGDSEFENLQKKIKKLSPLGQPVYGYYVTCDTEIAVQRALDRAIKTGRYIPEVVVRMSHAGVSQVFDDAVVAGLFSKAVLYENNGGGDPVLILSATGSKYTIHDEAAWKRFLAKEHEYD